MASILRWNLAYKVQIKSHFTFPDQCEALAPLKLDWKVLRTWNDQFKWRGLEATGLRTVAGMTSKTKIN